MQKTLELIAQLKTKNNLSIWEPTLSTESPLADQRCYTITYPGEFNVYIEKTKNNEPERLVIKRTTGTKQNKILSFRKKRYRQITFSSLAAIGDKESSDSTLEHVSMQQDSFENSIALKLRGTYDCHFSDNEVFLRQVI